MTDPVEHERNLLGALLLSTSDKPIAAVLVDEHLRSTHFYRRRHQLVFKAIVNLYDRDEPVDTLTVQAELERMGEIQAVEKPYLHSLPNMVPAAGHYRAYAKRVIELAKLRGKKAAAQQLLEAVENEDLAAIAECEVRLSAVEPERKASLTPEGWAEVLLETVESGPPEVFRWPFASLDAYTVGGMRRKGTTLVGAWTNTGKSVWIDQVLEHAAGEGARAHLYINEMGLEERGFRIVSRRAGIPYKRLALSELTDEDRPRFVRELNNMPFGVTECAGWTAAEIAHDIRRHRWDLWAVDILHRIPGGGEEKDWARMSSVLTDVAKRSSSHGLIAVHLNEANAKTGKLPKPVLRDIRGSGSLKNDADNVLFLWRAPDGDTMGDEGRIYFAKVRSGVAGGMDVLFNGRRMRFQLPSQLDLRQGQVA